MGYNPITGKLEGEGEQALSFFSEPHDFYYK